MKVAVGSTNPAKVEAVKRVFEHFFPGIDLVAVNSPSGISDMPLSDEESINGAINRATHARQSSGADYGVGLEGGVQDFSKGMMLHGIVAVVDRSGQYGLGDAPGLVIPEKIAQRIRQGEELGPIMDELIGESDIKKKMGAVGVFTNGYVNRSDGFEAGVALALARFIRKDLFE